MNQSMTAKQFRSQNKRKQNKYRNKKVELDGHVFDSILESRYYTQLKWLKQAKQIKDFTLQPRFLLQEAFEKNGLKHRSINYVADFEIHNLDGSIEIIDVKGTLTEVFKIKRKLFEKKYPYKLSIVSYDSNFGGWIEYERLQELKKQNKS